MLANETFGDQRTQTTTHADPGVGLLLLLAYKPYLLPFPSTPKARATNEGSGHARERDVWQPTNVDQRSSEGVRASRLRRVVLAELLAERPSFLR